MFSPLTYVINGRPERTAGIETRCREAGVVPHLITPPEPRHILNELTPVTTWRDPHSGRYTTLGELCCAWGHAEAWRQIASGSAPWALIVEDDAVFRGPLDRNAIEPVDGVADLVYLGGKLLDPVEADIDDRQRPRLGDTYWTVGYTVTKTAAERLLMAFHAHYVLPVDEFIPYHFMPGHPRVQRELHQQWASRGLTARKVAWTKEAGDWLIEPARQEGDESATEASPAALIPTVLMVGTDAARVKPIKQEWEDAGYKVDVLGTGESEWDTTGRSGMRKIALWRDWLDSRRTKSLTESTELARILRQADLNRLLCICVDGYDTLPLVTPEELVHRWASFKSPLVVSGEKTLWPADDELMRASFKARLGADGAERHYEFPCSGVVIGLGGALYDQLDPDTTVDDDQLYVQGKVLASRPGPHGWMVDTESYVAAHINHSQSDYCRHKGRTYNRNAGVFPAILHANGNSDWEHCKPLEWQALELHPDAFKYKRELDRDIIATPFLSPESVAAIDRAGLAVPGLWGSLEGDNVPGHELRIHALDTEWDRCLRLHWMGAKALVESHWPKTELPELSRQGLFLIDYSASGQPELTLHNDIARFSASVIVRRACKGGRLQFPRQNVTDIDVDLGWMLIWPSSIVAPHAVSRVHQGRRCSMVFWSNV